MKIMTYLSTLLLVQSFCFFSSAQTTSRKPYVILWCALASRGTTTSFRVDLNAGIHKVESKPTDKVSALIVNVGVVPNKIGLYIKGPSEAVQGEEFDLDSTRDLSIQSKNADGSLNFLSCQEHKQ